MKIKIPPTNLIEETSFLKAWERQTRFCNNFGMILPAIEKVEENKKIVMTKDINSIIVLIDNAIQEVIDGKLHPDFPTKEKFLEEYKQQVTCEYALVHRKLPIKEQFEYLYVERLTGCTSEEFENMVNQLKVMSEQLERYGINRRTQAITWIPEIDLYSEEPPCLQRVWVRPLSFDMQIPDEKIPIEFHLTWRSRDGKKAWMTNEVAILFMMYQYVFKDKYKVVKIVDFCNSFHIYEDDWDDAKNIRILPVSSW